jgi:hypothetical protein
MRVCVRVLLPEDKQNTHTHTYRERERETDTHTHLGVNARENFSFGARRPRKGNKLGRYDVEVPIFHL